jgi:hypothetical protein
MPPTKGGKSTERLSGDTERRWGKPQNMHGGLSVTTIINFPCRWY